MCNHHSSSNFLEYPYSIVFVEWKKGAIKTFEIGIDSDPPTGKKVWFKLFCTFRV